MIDFSIVCARSFVFTWAYWKRVPSGIFSFLISLCSINLSCERPRPGDARIEIFAPATLDLIADRFIFRNLSDIRFREFLEAAEFRHDSLSILIVGITRLV